MLPDRFFTDAAKAACAVVLLTILAGCAAPSAALRANGIADLTPADESSELGGDAEPVDPLEQRVAIIPPPRPDTEGTEGLSQISQAANTWVSRGPSPTRSAQVSVPPDNEVSGAVQAIAAHPTNANILYVGAVNGGIWRTYDA
ncbi:MAG: hypothetical protein WBP11_01885, partial [Dokdonella sp.]